MKKIQTLLGTPSQNCPPITLFATLLPNMPAMHQETLQHCYAEIFKLRAELDQASDIQTCFTKTTHDQPVYWRRATVQQYLAHPFNEPSHTNINQLRLFYAYLMAAIVIDFIFSTDGFNDNFADAVLRTEIEVKTNMLTPAEGKTRLIEALCYYHQQLTISEAEKCLDETKNWVGLLAPTTVSITSIQIDDASYFYIVDKPLTQLTLAQKAQFENLPSHAWYRAQPSFIQLLIQFFLPHILSETRVIPSQLRHILPVLRNCYRQTLYQKNSQGNVTQLNQYFHTGTAAYLGNCDENTATRLTRQNLHQEKQLSKTKQPLMICLNSVMGDIIVGTYNNYVRWSSYQYDDSTILTRTQRAAQTQAPEKSPAFYAKLCLNGYRHTEFNDYTGINQLIALMQDAMPLRENPDLKAIQAIQSSYSDNDVKSLSLIFHLTQLVKTYNQFIKSYNQQYQRCIPDAEPIPTFAVWFGCASGENRTGIAIYHLILETFFQAYPEVKQASELIARTQHIHLMTGGQGNTFGTEGIRAKSRLSFKSTHDQIDLITPIADCKQLPYTLISEAKRKNLTLFSRSPILKNTTSPPAPKPL